MSGSLEPAPAELCGHLDADPLLTFVKNTAFLTIIVTILQVLTSSFAAYAFAKLNFKGKNVLFLGYIATIAVPWQAWCPSS